MDKQQYPDDSESSDEDFDPGKLANEAVSEVDSDGDSEDPLSDKEDLGTRSKRRKRNNKTRKKPKMDHSEESSPEKKELTEEEKKKKVDDLWAMFKKDTGFKSRSTSTETLKSTPEDSTTKPTPSTPKEETKEPQKIKVTQIFEFAGEEVVVEKEVAANSQEAKLLSSPSSSNLSKGKGPTRGRGIGSFLSNLGKKQKITTLEKSKLDWDKFKRDENLEEELHTFNKGKDGYLEKQDFLQRTDVRRFEIERDVRNIERNKRMNENVN